jgi:hypothetical protein
MAIKKTVTARSVQGYCWVPDLPDQRDFTYAAPTPFQQDLPDSVDLSSKCTHIR